MKTKMLFCVVVLVLTLAVPRPMAAAAPQPGIGKIDVEKYVSFGGAGTGVAWIPADDLPGAYGLAGGKVYFKYWVKNTGGIPIYGVQLLELAGLDLSRCATVAPLMPGASFECVVGPFRIPAGQSTSTVTAIGTVEGGSVKDSDNANYFGAVVRLQLEDSVGVSTPDITSVTWYNADDPPGPYVLAGSELYFKYRGTNSGNVPLSGISLERAGAGVEQFGCIILEPLMPGASFECVVGPLPALAGQQQDAATARGKFLGWSAEDSDAAFYFGAVVDLDIEDFIGFSTPDITSLQWYDADDPPGLMVVVGSEIYLKWSGTNTGNVPLESFQLLGASINLSDCGIAEPVMPGMSFECISGPFRAQDGLQGSSTAAEGRFGAWTVKDSDSTFYSGVYVNDGTADRAATGAARAASAR